MPLGGDGLFVMTASKKSNFAQQFRGCAVRVGINRPISAQGTVPSGVACRVLRGVIIRLLRVDCETSGGAGVWLFRHRRRVTWRQTG